MTPRPPRSTLFPYRRSSDLACHPQGSICPTRATGTPSTGYRCQSATKSLHWFKDTQPRSEEHTSELQSLRHLVCRLLLEKKNISYSQITSKHSLSIH